MKRLLIGIFVILFVFLSYILLRSKESVHTFEISFKNKIGLISIYNTNGNTIEELKEKIPSLLREYEILIDRYNHYEGIKNLYYIRTNQEKSEYIEIDSKLYNMIKVGLLWREKSNGLIDIRYGNVADIWSSYKNQTTSLPTTEELSLAQQFTVLDVVLKDDNQIKNNHLNLMLDDIASAYLVDEIANILEQKKVPSYSIHLDNVIRVGKRYHKEPYKIGLESFADESIIATTIEAESESIVSIGSDKEFSLYKDTLYHTFIPATSLTPFTKKEAFRIIGPSALEAQAIAYRIYEEEEKEKAIQQYSGYSLLMDSFT